MMQLNVPRALALGLVMSAGLLFSANRSTAAAPYCSECDALLNACYSNCRTTCGADQQCVGLCAADCEVEPGIVWCYEHCVPGD